MAGRAGEKHRKENQKAKQSQDGATEESKELLLASSPHSPAMFPSATSRLYPASGALAIISKDPVATCILQ